MTIKGQAGYNKKVPMPQELLSHSMELIEQELSYEQSSAGVRSQVAIGDFYQLSKYSKENHEY